MRYYLIAGEASGDLHAANLMKALKSRDPKAQFRCWGGNRMQEAGGELVRHYKEMNFMGFLEVALNIRRIMGYLRQCRKDIKGWAPDAVILVDYPGFNLRIARFAKEAGFRTFYYISPQLWAWRQSRAKIIKQYVDHMMVILPFEKDFYEKQWKYPVTFVGHPLLDVMETKPADSGFRQASGLTDKPIIALLPGSRKQEVRKMLPLMLALQPHFDAYQFVVAGVTDICKAEYLRLAGTSDVNIVFDHTYELLQHADAALVTSGTATLEAALFGVPQVVCYKGNWLSYLIGRMLVRVPYISLVNLVLERPLLQELIQGDCTVDKMRDVLRTLLHDPVEQMRIKEGYAELRQKLGNPGVAKRAADVVYNSCLP